MFKRNPATKRGGRARTHSPSPSNSTHRGPPSSLNSPRSDPDGSLYSTSHAYNNDDSYYNSMGSYGGEVRPMRRFSSAASASGSQSTSWGTGEASTLSRALYQSSPNLHQSATEESMTSGHHRQSIRSLSRHSGGDKGTRTPDTAPMALSATVTGSRRSGDSGTRAGGTTARSGGSKLRRRRSSFVRRRHHQDDGDSTNSGPTSQNPKAADALRRPIIAWREPYRVTALAAGTGGRIFAGGDLTGGIAVFDSRTGTREYLIGGHQGPVLALSSLPEMDALLSGGTDGTARLWSISTLQNTLVMEGHKGFVSTVALSRDGVGLVLLTGGDDGAVRQWCPGTGVCLHVYRGHAGSVNTVCSLRDGCEVASGGADGTLRVWSIITHKRLAVVDAHPGSSVWSLAALEMDRLATAGGETTEAAAIRIWALLSQQRPQLLMEVRISSLQSVRCLLNYRHYLFSAGERGELFMWDLLTGEAKATLVFHTRTITGLTLENNKLCSSCQDHSISRWSIQDLLESGELQPLVPYQPLGIASNTLDTVFGGNYFRGEMESNADAGRAGDHYTEEEQRHRVIDGDERRQNALTSHIQQFLKGESYKRIFFKTTGDNAPQMITHAEAAILHPTLPLDFILNQLDHFQVDFRWLISFLFFVIFLVCFTVLFIAMYPTEDSFYLTAGLEAQVEHSPLPGLRTPRTFASITSSHLFFQWLREATTNLWADRDSNTSYPTWAGGSILLTAMHIRVLRHDATSCTWNPSYFTPTSANTTTGTTTGGSDAYSALVDAVPDGHLPCYADYKGKRSTKPYLCPMSSMCHGDLAAKAVYCPDLPYPVNCTSGFQYDANAGTRIRAMTRSYGRGGYAVNLFYAISLRDTQTAIQALENLGYIDDISTRLVSTHVYMYNPNVDLFLAQHYAAEVPFSGAWFTSTSTSAFEVYNPDTMSGRLGMHIFLFLLCILRLAMEVLQNVHSPHQAWFSFFYFWRLVSFANFVLLMVMSGFFFHWVIQSQRLDVGQLVRLSVNTNTSAAVTAQQTMNRRRLDIIQNSYNNIKLIAAVCAPLLYSRALFHLASTDFFFIFRLTLAHMRFLVLVPVFMFSLLMLFVAESVRVDMGAVTFDFRTFSSAYSALMSLFIGASLNAESSNNMFTNTSRAEAIIVLVFVLFVVQVALTSQFFVVMAESYRKVSRNVSKMPVVLVITQWLGVVHYRWQLTVVPRLQRYCGCDARPTRPHASERRSCSSRRCEAMIVRRLLLRLRAVRRLREDGDGDADAVPPPQPTGGAAAAGEGANSTTGGGDTITSPFTTSTDFKMAPHKLLPTASFSATPLGRSSEIFDATAFNVFGRRDGAVAAEGAAPLPLSSTMSNTGGPGTTTNSTTTAAAPAAKKAQPPRLAPADAESTAVLLRQVDLLSLLSSYYADIGDEDKDPELRRWEAEEEPHGGITTAARAIVSALWERMAYTYHIQLLYSDATRDTAETEELHRVTAALSSLADTMKLVGEVQASLEGHEAHLRPLAQALEECLT